VPTIPPANEEIHSTSVPCPACGVPVAVGYPRCPKCKAAVPMSARARRGSVREQLLSGGTSVEPEPSSVGKPWLPWVLVALVVVAIGAFLALRSGGDDDAAVAPGAKVEDEEAAEGDDDADEATTDDDVVTAPRGSAAPVVEPAADPMPDAVVSLDEALRGQRLWAKVTNRGTTLLIESSLCPQIEGQIDALAGVARGLGARAVECHAEHGQLMFERPL